MGVLIAGFGMIALTLAIHTLGASQWLKFAARRHRNAAEEKRLSNLFFILLYTASVLMLLHLLEAFLWALLFLQLPGQAGLSNLHDAFYFSVITFTTLGYGDITLSRDWQVLAGMEGMVGIIVFGLTTAVLFAIIQKSWSYPRHGKNEVNEK